MYIPPWTLYMISPPCNVFYSFFFKLTCMFICKLDERVRNVSAAIETYHLRLYISTGSLWEKEYKYCWIRHQGISYHNFWFIAILSAPNIKVILSSWSKTLISCNSIANEKCLVLYMHVKIIKSYLNMKKKISLQCKNLQIHVCYLDDDFSHTNIYSQLCIHVLLLKMNMICKYIRTFLCKNTNSILFLSFLPVSLKYYHCKHKPTIILNITYLIEFFNPSNEVWLGRWCLKVDIVCNIESKWHLF